MAASRQRVEQQPAWVLHSYPWRETSLIVELFARDHGRLALVAKGARRPHSQFRGVLMAFQPLLVDWSGRGEVKTLVRAEWQGGQPLLGGRALLCAYYLNELIVRLSAREDPHPALFDHYGEALAALASGAAEAPILRRFELALLRELGYEAGLASDGSGVPIDAAARYRYVLEHGPLRLGDAEAAGAAADDSGVIVSGRTLLDLDAGDFSRPSTLAEAKRLLRMLINHTLGGEPLQSRRVLKELQEL